MRGAWTDWLEELPSGSCAHVRGCIGQLSPNQRTPCAMTEASRRKCGFREATFPKLQSKAQPHLAGDDVKSIGQRAAGLADPVLNCSELPWSARWLGTSLINSLCNSRMRRTQSGGFLSREISCSKATTWLQTSRISSGLRSTAAPAAAASGLLPPLRLFSERKYIVRIFSNSRLLPVLLSFLMWNQNILL